MQKLEKNWETSAPYGANFATWLVEGESLATPVSIEFVSSPDGGQESDLNIGSASISGTNVVATIAGGKCLNKKRTGRWETRYFLKARGMTDAGAREVDDIELVVYSSIERTAVYS